MASHDLDPISLLFPGTAEATGPDRGRCRFRPSPRVVGVEGQRATEVDMHKQFEVRWEGELPARPQDVWDAVTKQADGYLWPIEYEPRLGGAERGLTSSGGIVTAWDPPRRFATRTRPGADGLNELEYRFKARGPITYLSYLHRTEVP